MKLSCYKTKAFSKLEWVSVAFVVVCIFTLLLPKIFHGEEREKANEAINTLQEIFDAEQRVFAQKRQENPATAQYIALPATPPNPSFEKRTAAFGDAPWSEISLQIDPEVYFSYEVIAHGQGEEAFFEAFARGDLDGDGIKSLYKIRGSIDPNGTPEGRENIYRLDPFE